jgi:hypothetical protein
MKQTHWSPVPGYEGHYEVSRDGLVRSLSRRGFDGRSVKEKYLALRPSGIGYLAVHLRKDNTHKYLYVHRAVAEAFIENPLHRPEVNHKNGVKTDNRVENLEWATRSEQELHKYQVLGYSGTNLGKSGAKNYASIKVVAVNIDDGTLLSFESMSLAAASLSLSDGEISRCVRGLAKRVGRYKFSRAAQETTHA